METLAAVLLYLGLLTPECYCYTEIDVEETQQDHQEQVDEVYSNEEELNYAIEVWGPEVNEIWLPETKEIAY